MKHDSETLIEQLREAVENYDENIYALALKAADAIEELLADRRAA